MRMSVQMFLQHTLRFFHLRRRLEVSVGEHDLCALPLRSGWARLLQRGSVLDHVGWLRGHGVGHRRQVGRHRLVFTVTRFKLNFKHFTYTANTAVFGNSLSLAVFVPQDKWRGRRHKVVPGPSSVVSSVNSELYLNLNQSRYNVYSCMLSCIYNLVTLGMEPL